MPDDKPEEPLLPPEIKILLFVCVVYPLMPYLTTENICRFLVSDSIIMRLKQLYGGELYKNIKILST